jgi:hypothetical protein
MKHIDYRIAYSSNQKHRTTERRIYLLIGTHNLTLKNSLIIHEENTKKNH